SHFVLRTAVLLREPITAPVQLVAERALDIVGGIGIPRLQLGDHELDDVLERAGGDRIGEVESVDVGLVNPRLKLVRDLRTRANDAGTEPTDACPGGD